MHVEQLACVKRGKKRFRVEGIISFIRAYLRDTGSLLLMIKGKQSSVNALSLSVLSLANRLPFSISLYDKSRMIGDNHVRFCKRYGVKFPVPT